MAVGESLAKFQLPSLAVQRLRDTGVFPSDAHKIFCNIASPDKRLELIKGAHYFEESRREREVMVGLVWI